MKEDIENIYDTCVIDGKIVITDEIDLGKAKSLFESAANELRIAKKIEKLDENVESHLFKTYYDAFRQLANAFIIFDKTDISSHPCLFSYIIVRHPELEFDWGLLDGIMQIRNRICYYGKNLSREEWKEYKLKFEIYIKALEKEVSQKIKAFNQDF